jgi:hypothetical protein
VLNACCAAIFIHETNRETISSNESDQRTNQYRSRPDIQQRRVMKGNPPGTFDPIGFCQIYIKQVKNFYLPELDQK